MRQINEISWYLYGGFIKQIIRMSKKQQASKYNKYYHNDIKKQLGIDESRTASQKLLDKAMKVDKRADFQNDSNILTSQPRKKVKVQSHQNQTPLSNLQILEQKLFKNISNQQNMSKLLKSLKILKKCLNQEAFINDSQVNFSENWRIYADKLISEANSKNCSSGQSFVLMESIGDCIQILWRKFGRKHQLEKVEDGEVGDNLNGQSQQVLPREQCNISFARLFTDDSFVFNRHISKLKKFIFSQFENEQASSNQSKQLALIMINKLVNMLVKFDWAHTSLVNLFKDFNNQGYQNNFQSEDQRKSYLKKYNELLNKKNKLSVDTGSYNMMGNTKSTIGVKTVHIQTVNQGSTDKWISKQ